MAFSVRKINPLDLEPRKALGVTLPFSGRSVFNQSYTTKDAIRTNLINLLLTIKGERILNTEFGTNLTRNLFENITESKLKTIKQEVTDSLKLYFPSLNVISLQIQSQPDNNTFTVFLQYNVENTNIEDEIIINVEV